LQSSTKGTAGRGRLRIGFTRGHPRTTSVRIRCGETKAAGKKKIPNITLRPEQKLKLPISPRKTVTEASEVKEGKGRREGGTNFVNSNGRGLK